MGLTCYVGTCKGCIEQSGHLFEAWDSHAMWEHAKVVLSNQDIPSEILEAWDSQAMLKHAKIV